MRVLTEPPRQDFRIYVARPEVHFATREPGDRLSDIYAKGYLPYSGTSGLHDVFYSARSARVVLSELTVTSENRRIAKRFDGMLTKRRTPYNEFDANEQFVQFFLTYFSERHGPAVMPLERLCTLLDSGIITHVVEYKRGTAVVGYVLEVCEGNMRHYWYSAYDLSYVRQSLGMWLMLDCVRDARTAGVAYYYLGTVYGDKALYKTNFEPLEWWDGKEWSHDIKALKQLSRQ